MLRCNQLQDLLEGERPWLSLGRLKSGWSCQVTQRKGIGQCSGSRAEGDGGGVARPTGVMWGWGSDRKAQWYGRRGVEG